MQHYLDRPQENEEDPDFGTFLKLLRTQKHIRQGTIAALLVDKGWTPTTYTRLENGDIAPRFADLLPLYRAFVFAGISFSLSDRQQFVQRARVKIERKKTHREQHSDAEWAELRYELARLDGLPETASPVAISARLSRKPLLTDTDHLLGREQWRENLLVGLQGSARKKLIIIRGSSGIGKSSELHWLATTFLRHSPTTHHVLLCDLRSLSHAHRPEDAFHVFAYTLLTELGCAHTPTTIPSLDELARQVLEQLEKARLPLLVLLDHAEGLLQENGSLAPCWERLFMALLRVQHNSTLVLTSQQWPGWYQGERQFLVECSLPPLSCETSLLVLQQHGLDSVPVALLQQIYDRVGGIPLALEWVAALVKQPLEIEDWAEFGEIVSDASADGNSMTSSIERLLTEPHIFGGSLADDIAPLLQRIIATQHLSPEARTLLEVLTVARIPLAKPALQHLCSLGPRPIKELRRASVLVSYPERIQLLPMVAAAMYRQLTFEQRKEREEMLIEACQAWIKQGTLNEQEQGAVITELATLLLKHHRLLEVADLLIYYGWISFKLGNGPNLARLTEKVLRQIDWQETPETKCAGLLLQKLLLRFLGKRVDSIGSLHYEYLRKAVLAHTLKLPDGLDYYLTRLLMMYAMNDMRFEEAHAVLDAHESRLEQQQLPDSYRRITVLNEHAWLLGKWCEYLEEQGDIQKAQELREQAISLYEEYCAKFRETEAWSPLNSQLSKKKLSHILNALGYHLNRMGRYEQALKVIEQCIELDQQGYATVGAIAASYGEKSQILMELGRFQEALLFDEKAVAEIQRRLDANDAQAQSEIWIYRVNRGRLYIRLGRVDEAEALVREALPHIRPERRTYRMFADNALGEIEQWRQQAKSPHYQMDWRWVERYRELAAYDSHGWMAAAGPFTEEEQQQWQHLFTPPLDAVTKERAGELLAQTRDRELTVALAEQRIPRLHHPAIEIEEVRRRITDLLQLNTEISQQEPNAIVRRLYAGAIEEEVDYLRSIEASYEGDSEKYWLHMCRLVPPPTVEEMDEALDHVKRMVIQGLHHPETSEISQRFREFLQEKLQISMTLPPDAEDIQEIPPVAASSSVQASQTVSHQAAKCFFEAALQEGGYDGWHVLIDPAATIPRVEKGLRHFFLPQQRFSLYQIRYWLAHEIAGHVGRAVAGERSLLGLLGIHTKNSLPTEEGFVKYHERQIALLHGESTSRGGWVGTLATGLVSGVVNPPQTFLTLYTFMTFYALLHQLLQRLNVNVQRAEQYAHRYALARCLRTYVGTPDLNRAGICYLQDAVYLRGIRMVERAVAEDKTVLDRLAVGVVALDLLPDLQALGITSAPQPLMAIAYAPDLDARILSFEVAEEQVQP